MERLPPEDEENEERMTRQEMPDNDTVPSQDEESGYQVPSQDIPDNNVIMSENQRAVEQFLSNYVIPYSEIGMF